MCHEFLREYSNVAVSYSSEFRYDRVIVFESAGNGDEVYAYKEKFPEWSWEWIISCWLCSYVYNLRVICQNSKFNLQFGKNARSFGKCYQMSTAFKDYRRI